MFDRVETLLFTLRMSRAARMIPIGIIPPIFFLNPRQVYIRRDVPRECVGRRKG